MAARNIHTGGRTASTVATDVDTNGSGDTTITVGEFRQIDDAANVNAQAVGGYTANVQSVSGNQVTVRIFQSSGNTAAHAAVDGTDITDVYVNVTET